MSKSNFKEGVCVLAALICVISIIGFVATVYCAIWGSDSILYLKWAATWFLTVVVSMIVFKATE